MVYVRIVGYENSFASAMEPEKAVHLRAFVFVRVKDPAFLNSLLSSYADFFDPKKKDLPATPFVAPASNTIFSSIAPALIVFSFSSSDEVLTFPAERDNIMVQISPQAVNTGISGRANVVKQMNIQALEF